VIGWMLLVCFFVVFCVIFMARFWGGKWKRIRVI